MELGQVLESLVHPCSEALVSKLAQPQLQNRKKWNPGKIECGPVKFLRTRGPVHLVGQLAVQVLPVAAGNFSSVGREGLEVECCCAFCPLNY